MIYPDSIKRAIECFKMLPGVGEKTAQRMVFSLLNCDKNVLTNFSQALVDIRDNICYCEVCNNISDKDRCLICDDKKRNNQQIFIVEKAKDVALFEKIGIYNGLYHVLGGLISPIDGIGPDDIKIDLLVERVKNGTVKEIIFALKPSIEGETTMQYIKKILSFASLEFSKIASGVPIGTDMEYIDNLTLELALEERKKF